MVRDIDLAVCDAGSTMLVVMYLIYLSATTLPLIISLSEHEVLETGYREAEARGQSDVRGLMYQIEYDPDLFSPILPYISHPLQ